MKQVKSNQLELLYLSPRDIDGSKYNTVVSANCNIQKRREHHFEERSKVWGLDVDNVKIDYTLFKLLWLPKYS